MQLFEGLWLLCALLATAAYFTGGNAFEFLSETRWRLAEARDSLGRYELEPVTGKRHQLRVHMAALGVPIAGDRFYPDVLETAEQAPGFEAPLQLLARGLAFTDPVTGTERVFESRQRLAWPPAGAGAA